MYSKEEALSKISELVEKFSDQLPAYKKSDYNETLTRKDFIDPFFEALGWDINNRSGAWEAYREVIHEDRLKIGGVTTAPEYSFRLIGGQRLFLGNSLSPCSTMIIVMGNTKLANATEHTFYTDLQQLIEYTLHRQQLIV